MTSSASTDAPPALGILPIANYSGDGRALTVVMHRLYRGLAESNVPLIADTALRPILRRHRIRVAGAIGREDATLIAQQTGVQYLLLGSIDFFDSQGAPEFGMSVRVLRIDDMRIIRAASAAASGEDFAGLFGIGRIRDVDVLADRVMERLFDRLGTPLLTPAAPPPPLTGCSSVVIIPFDNASESTHGGEVMTVLLLNELIRRGFTVIEPGVVDEVFLRERVMPRGQLAFDTLAQLQNAAEFCYVMTGYVDGFEPAAGDAIQSTPRLGLGLRILDASDGTVITARAAEKLGSDSELLFRAGRLNALGKLTSKTLRRLIDQLTEKTEDYLASTP